ncbi:MAG: hypothetical protein AAB305_07455 [Candidatus Zixiibacteriota bacterium]
MPSPRPERDSQPQSWFQRHRLGLREFGFEHVLRVLCWHLPSGLFNYNHAIMFVTDNLCLDIRSNPDYRVRLATKEDANAMGDVDIDSETFLMRLRRGDTSAVVTRGERLVCINWASIHRVFSPLTGSILDPGADGVYFYNLFTPPVERGRGLTRLIYKIQAEHHRAQGRNTVYAGVEIYNTISIILHERFGFRRAGETVKVTFLGVNICWYKSWPHPTRKFHVYFRMPTDIEWA